MSDPRHMHEFNPNKNGLCKSIVGAQICHLVENADVHRRFREMRRKCPHTISTIVNLETEVTGRQVLNIRCNRCGESHTAEFSRD